MKKSCIILAIVAAVLLICFQIGQKRIADKEEAVPDNTKITGRKRTIFSSKWRALQEKWNKPRLNKRQMKNSPQVMNDLCLDWKVGLDYQARKKAVEYLRQWALTDPHAALSWLNSHNEKGGSANSLEHNSGLYSALLAGSIGCMDVKQALIMMKEETPYSEEGDGSYGFDKMYANAVWMLADDTVTRERFYEYLESVTNQGSLEEKMELGRTVAQHFVGAVVKQDGELGLDLLYYFSDRDVPMKLGNWGTSGVLAEQLPQRTALWALENDQESLASLIYSWGKKSPDDAVKWTMEHTTGPLQHEVLSLLVARLNTRDQVEYIRSTLVEVTPAILKLLDDKEQALQ